jgi:hypothetical protein
MPLARSDIEVRESLGLDCFPPYQHILLALAPVPHRWMNQSPAQASLGKIESMLGDKEGPFFMGSDFTIVDCVYAPFLERWRFQVRIRSTNNNNNNNNKNKNSHKNSIIKINLTWAIQGST